MSRQERREHLNFPKSNVSGKNNYAKDPFRKGKKKRKRFNFKKIVVSLIAIFAMATYLAISSFSQYDAKFANNPTKSKSTVSPSPSSSPVPTVSVSLGYNQIDALSILGVFALAREIPEGNQKLLDSFRVALAQAKKTHSSATLDLGVYGNILTDYTLSSKGLLDPACFAVSAPNVPSHTPNQKSWVIYLEPKSKKFDSLVMVSKGVLTCQQAITAASEISNKSRAKVSSTSQKVIKESLLTIPTSFLTKEGLILLDEDRGLAK